MNIILIGANGAGKTTLSKMLYKEGYHLFKLSPLSNNNTAAISLALNDMNVVFDRWSPVDLAIYRNDENLLTQILPHSKIINENNVIFYLENFTEYDDAEDSDRVIQRPSYEELLRIIQRYRVYVKRLSDVGIHVYHINVRSDIQETADLVHRIIKEVSEQKVRKN